MSSFQILSVDSDNAKLAKSQAYGYLSAGLSLAPADTSGFNVCQFAGFCKELCVAHSGMGGVFPSIEEARIRKTQLLFRERDKFMELVRADMLKVEGLAESLGLGVHFRFNTFSDLPWRRIYHSGGWNLFDVVERMRRNVRKVCSDYTKDVRRVFEELKVSSAVPWHNVFSRSETNDMDCERVLRLGGKVAVPFDVKRGQKLPKYWKGWAVVDGDVHDLTFLHQGSIVIGLRAKGAARNSDSPFIVDCHEQLVNDRLHQLV
jgi:hypothetical protein